MKPLKVLNAVTYYMILYLKYSLLEVNEGLSHLVGAAVAAVTSCSF